MRRVRWLLALVAVCIPATRGSAQLAGTMDGGWSYVTYDGFLPAHAGSLTAGVRYEHPALTVAARGTALRFETGNKSVAGSVGTSVYTRPYHALRGELSGFMGASRYEDFAQYGHAYVRARVHASTSDYGGWVDASGGRHYVAGRSGDVDVTGAGLWRRARLTTLTLSMRRVALGDTTYADAELGGRFVRSAVDIDASTGTRLMSRGGGRGMYGEVALTWWRSPMMAFGVSAGRYPSDPVQGTVAGRYVGANVHVGVRGSRADLARPRETLRGRLPAPSSFARPMVLEMRISRLGNGWQTFVLRAPGARTVELMGDFTDWLPVAMGRAGEEYWQVALPLGAGAHRLNVRIDGGPWTVPLGLAVGEDDLGGVSAIIVID